ncbi:hypothetical protein HMPREF0647_04720 [Prevotella bivia DNF00320]|uniref:Uncharacterized protein n=1 Tax=Prevotella bivia DNF00320 TaxID=1401068 RepID=A0A096CI32_9BACT|nr:hypothetical protein [Prevotella bivia]KGF44959.1 hypothetical protein HMPREF0647_04720 [Prevotella bivia DNF00320]
MDIPQTLIDKAVSDEVRLGDVYKIELSKADGIIPKNGYDTRDKFFVVLGFDEQGNVYGGILFNSKINQNLPTLIKDYHMPISAKVYPFLSHDSFLNCTKIFSLTSTHLMKGEKLGTINTTDFELICSTVCSYPNAVPRELKRFGLI